jgi:hypothetical protein
LTTSCAPASPDTATNARLSAANSPAAAVSAAATSLPEPAEPCSGTFVAYDLDHTTQAPGAVARLFDSNGSGLAVADLDGDGNQDIVLGNLAGATSILWNQGDLEFDRQELPGVLRIRAVAAVDVNGDGRQDIALTNGAGAPAVFLNQGNRTFRLAPLPGVRRPAYAMNWNDLDGDGDLDLVAGSYDAGRMVETGSNYLFSEGAGVNVYLHDGDAWQSTQLTTTANALAIGLWDLNGDRRPDIWVGNDFDDRDEIWLQVDDGWQPATPFRRYSHSTMGIDRGDLDGNGAGEFFTTDMKPYRRDPQTTAAWLPLMEKGYQSRRQDSPQISENTLQVWTGDRYQNQAYERSIDAAGWGWSGKFGDLDLDGDLDLYVVNGMIAADLLAHLPDGELVEENQAFRNDGTGHFAVARAWGLGSTRSGRGMSMADFDLDGDLDIVVNNLGSPAQLFENRLCAEGAGLEVDLRQPGTANPFAVGATALLHTDKGVLLRDVRAVSGYLSGDPARLHFGIPQGAVVEMVEIRWPDGAVSQVEKPAEGQLLTITRKQGA